MLTKEQLGELSPESEVSAVQTALLSVSVIVSEEILYTWPGWQRADAFEWAIHNAAVVARGEGELREPLPFLLEYLHDDEVDSGELGGHPHDD